MIDWLVRTAKDFYNGRLWLGLSQEVRDVARNKVVLMAALVLALAGTVSAQDAALHRDDRDRGWRGFSGPERMFWEKAEELGCTTFNLRRATHFAVFDQITDRRLKRLNRVRVEGPDGERETFVHRNAGTLADHVCAAVRAGEE